MDRSRSQSVSDSQYHHIYPIKKPLNQAQAGHISASSSLTSLHRSVPIKSKKEFAKTSLNIVLADYKFLGNIITFKPQDEYGFIRSEQVTGDVFFSLHHLDIGDKGSCSGVLGRWVNFTIKDAGKKSMEARRVSIVPFNIRVLYLSGRIMNWIKNGCLVQVTSGLGLQNLHNRIFAPFVETEGFDKGEVGIEVNFKIHVDRSFKMEARDVKKVEKNEDIKEVFVKVRKPRRRAVTEGGLDDDNDLTEGEKLMSVKNLTTDEFSEELVISVESMDSINLSSLFGKQLKSRLLVLVQQVVGSKVVIAVIKRAGRLEGINIEDKITRMIMANFVIICSTKQGCSVVQAGLENFSQSNKVMLAEQLMELDSVEQFTTLWVYGSHIFTMMISLLDESSLSMVGFSLCGEYVTLSCHIRHYKPIKALLVSLVNTDSYTEILPEVEQKLIYLACNKFGHFVVSALMENSPPTIKNRLIGTFLCQIAELSTHQVCHAVIVTAIQEGTDSLQATFIEEVCTVNNNQAEMAVNKLTKDRYGHVVVLAMLQVSRHKQVHNLLKASILCKQDDLLENEFNTKVFKTIKTEFHNRLSGNYAK